MSNTPSFYDIFRDPRNSHRRNYSMEMSDAGPEEKPTLELSSSASLAESSADTADGREVRILRSRVTDLVARIANQSEDTAKLQRKKSNAKIELEDTYARLDITTQLHADITNSQAKRTHEKKNLITVNADLEKDIADLQETIAAQLHIISDRKIQISNLQNENERLLERLELLETERDILLRRVKDLELKDEQRDATNATTSQLRKHTTNHVTYTGRGEAYRVRYDLERADNCRDGLRERSHDEERERVSWYERSDTYRPFPGRSDQQRRDLYREDIRDGKRRASAPGRGGAGRRLNGDVANT